MNQGMDLAIGAGSAQTDASLKTFTSGASAWTWRVLALVGIYVAVGYATAATLGLPLHWPMAHLVTQIQIVTVLAYASLALAYVLHRAFPQLRLGALSGRLFSLQVLFEFAAAMLAVHVTLVVFVNLKQYIPALNPTLYDSPLWRLDAWMHFGVDPAVWATEFAARNGLVPFLDTMYLVFFPVQLLVPLLFLFSTRLRPLRGTFFAAYCLLWMVGSAIYILWPALGPVYYRPMRFLTMELAPFAEHLQWTLIQDYARFRAGPEYYAVKLYYGVAALPSLHVGMFTLFSLATWRWRGVSLVLWVLTAITFAGSLALGWHYAVDGYAGALMAWGTWRLGRALASTDDTADDSASVAASES